MNEPHPVVSSMTRLRTGVSSSPLVAGLESKSDPSMLLHWCSSSQLERDLGRLGRELDLGEGAGGDCL